MIRNFCESDLPSVMRIWLDSNLEAHSFIPPEYWRDNFEAVKAAIPQAEIYVYESEPAHRIDGFIGLNGDCIEGIFVKKGRRSNGIGKQLLDHVKKFKTELRLNVYQKNSKAVSFYQRENFVPLSEYTDSATGEKDLLMLWHR